MKSRFLTLNEIDFIKGFIMACLGAFIIAIYNILVAGTTFGKAQLVACGLAGITAGLAYLIKNLFTNSEDKLVTPESR